HLQRGGSSAGVAGGKAALVPGGAGSRKRRSHQACRQSREPNRRTCHQRDGGVDRARASVGAVEEPQRVATELAEGRRSAVFRVATTGGTAGLAEAYSRKEGVRARPRTRSEDPNPPPPGNSPSRILAPHRG